MNLEFLRKYFMITLGALLITLSINCFYVQHHFVSGGMSGVQMILYYLFNWHMGVTGILLNIPLFILAYIYLGKRFVIDSLYGTIIVNVFFEMTAFLAKETYVQNQLLSAIAGGAVFGVGCALLFKEDASTGGSDIVQFLINKFQGISIGTAGMLINIVVMTVSVFLFGLEKVLYSCISFYVLFKTINAFMDGFDFKKNFFIISDHSEELAKAIIKEVGRGVTYLHGTGAYTGQERKIIFVVVKLKQVAQISRLIKEIDPLAFVIIHDTSDVFGRGFSVGLHASAEEARAQIK
ncbi:MAG: YitT family protein [Phascolarctobacterium sp.]|nr:YitT family protein [Phascolarctobacterium sp.]